jgi:hypothetical protein
MLEFIKENSFLVGALSGSLAAYLLGLVVSHVRREKRWLGYLTDNRNIVRSQHSDLAFTFKNVGINRLDSHSVQLRNIGNRALVQLPVRIAASAGARILEHSIGIPKGASFDAANPYPNEIRVTFDLLQPSETAKIELTVADSPDGLINVIARVDGLTVIDMTDKIASKEFLVDLLSTMPGFSPFGLIIKKLF